MIQFIIANAGAGIVAFSVSRFLFGRRLTLTHGLAGPVIFLLVAYLTVLFLGWAGHLSSPAATTVVGLAAAVCLGLEARRSWSLRRRSPDGDSAKARASAFAQTSEHLVIDWPGRFVVATALILALPILVETLWRGTRLGWDDLWYHSMMAVQWIQARSLHHEQVFSFAEYYAASGEVIAVWFMLPFSDGPMGELFSWASLTAPLYLLILIMSVAVICQRTASPPLAWAILFVVTLTDRRFRGWTTQMADVDFGVAVMLVAALAFAVPRPGEERTLRGCISDGMLAACLCGLAVGTKVTAVLGLAVIAVLYLVRVDGVRRPKVGTAVAVGWALLTLLLGGYWYARNLYVTGNPLYPGAVPFLASGFDFGDTTLTHFVAIHGLKKTIAEVFLAYFQPTAPSVLMGIGFLFGTLSTAARWRKLTCPARYWAVGSLALAALVVITLPIIPFSAGPEGPAGIVHRGNVRYVLIVVFLGWIWFAMLLSSGLAGPGWIPKLAALAVIVIVVQSWRRSVYLVFPAVLFTLGITAIWERVRTRGKVVPESIVRWVAGAGVLGFFGFLVWHHPVKSAWTLNDLYQRIDPKSEAGWRFLNGLSAGCKICVYGSGFFLPLCGGELQHTPIAIGGAGERASRFPDASDTSSTVAELFPGTLVANLRQSGVDIVLTVRDHFAKNGGWPVQHGLLQRSGVDQVFDDGEVSIWDLRTKVAAPGPLTPPDR